MWSRKNTRTDGSWCWLQGRWLLVVLLALAGEVVAQAQNIPPRAVLQVPPEYPFEMLLSGHRGRVIVEFVVDSEGVPRKGAIVSSNHPAFERSALDVVAKWRFAPASIDGRAVAARVRQELVFELRGDPGDSPFRAPERAPDSVPEQYRYDTAPDPDLIVWPVYPKELAVKGTGGYATVVFALSEQGVPVLVEAREATAPEFGAALVAAVESWRFAPAKKGGQPCPALLSYRHRFERGGEWGLGRAEQARILRILRKDDGRSLPELAGLDAVPALRFGVAPNYPVALRAQGVEGVVNVRFILDREGVPRFPVAVAAAEPELAWAAVTTAQRLRFEPPMKNGKPVDAWAVLPIAFSLSATGTESAPASAQGR